MPAGISKSLSAMKAERLEGWENVVVDGRPLLESLEQRVPTVFVNAVPFSGKVDGVPAIVPFGARKGGVAVVVPVAEDGYFLTAAHVVRRKSSLTIVLDVSWQDGKAKIEAAPARIVWEPTSFWVGGPDFAVVHADVGSLAPFKIDAELPRIDDPIVTAGSPSIVRTESARLLCSAGRILSVDGRSASRSAPAFVAVRHDAPTAPGDSGGPVLDRKGNLIGISSYSRVPIRNWVAGFLNPGRTQFDMRGFYSVAFMPDPDWLREVIERDRRSRIRDQDASNEAGR